MFFTSLDTGSHSTAQSTCGFTILLPQPRAVWLQVCTLCKFKMSTLGNVAYPLTWARDFCLLPHGEQDKSRGILVPNSVPCSVFCELCCSPRHQDFFYSSEQKARARSCLPACSTKNKLLFSQFISRKCPHSPRARGQMSCVI